MNFTPLIAALDNIEVEDDGFSKVITLACNVRHHGNRIFFIGNGGSAAIASHMAIDWLNKAHFAASSFNDAAALTCIANDYGFEQVFTQQLACHLGADDLLFAISSSGQSQNIIKAVQSANLIAETITLTGFSPNNPLRKLGKINFYVPSDNYGGVETAHLAILHALLERLAV